MLIKAYGLFWRNDEIDWSPGSGNRRAFRLLGRVGERKPRLRLADFRKQRGLYVLYDQYGPYYVGLTRRQDLGKRLRDHVLTDHHQDRWDRFSWFGFRAVSTAQDEEGLQKLRMLPLNSNVATSAAIADMEALLIWSLGLRANANWMHFKGAEQWHQINFDECDAYLDRVRF